MASMPFAAYKAGTFHDNLRKQCAGERSRSSSMRELSTGDSGNKPALDLSPLTIPSCSSASESPVGSGPSTPNQWSLSALGFNFQRPRSSSMREMSTEDSGNKPALDLSPLTIPSSGSASESPVGSRPSTPTQWSLSALGFNFQPLRARSSTWSEGNNSLLNSFI